MAGRRRWDEGSRGWFLLGGAIALSLILPGLAGYSGARLAIHLAHKGADNIVHF